MGWLDEDVYEHIKSKKRENETFSEAIARFTTDYSLLELAGIYSDEGAERHRDVLKRSEEEAQDDRQEMLERMGIDVD